MRGAGRPGAARQPHPDRAATADRRGPAGLRTCRSGHGAAAVAAPLGGRGRGPGARRTAGRSAGRRRAGSGEPGPAGPAAGRGPGLTALPSRCCSCASPLRARLAAEATRQARRLAGLAGTHGGDVVLLAPSEDPGALARSLAADVGRALDTPVTVGSGGPRGVARPDCRRRTVRRCAACRPCRRWAAPARAAACPNWVSSASCWATARDVSGYVRQVLGPVLDYDAHRGTELVRTLDAYYAQGASLARAKDAAARPRQHGGAATGPRAAPARAPTGTRRSTRWRSSWRCGLHRLSVNAPPES